jgi:transcriptional regulator with XRE-family HTH domain
MTPQQLVQLCTSIYGETGWSRALSDDIGINQRTIRRWAKGDGEPSSSVQDEIAGIVAQRLLAIATEASNALPGRFTIECSEAGYFTLRVRLTG